MDILFPAGKMAAIARIREKLIAKQDGRCAICGREFMTGRKPMLDHDHTTGKVRGVLCGSCNIRLTGIEDPDWAMAGLAYITTPPVQLLTDL